MQPGGTLAREPEKLRAYAIATNRGGKAIMAPTGRMQAMVLEAPGTPLRERQVPVPRPRAGEMLLAVRACGVCRTDLHIVDGELRDPKLPLIPGFDWRRRTRP